VQEYDNKSPVVCSVMVTHGVVKYDRLVARLDPTSSGRAITWSPPNASPLTGQWRSDEAFTSPFGHQVRRERVGAALSDRLTQFPVN
jgi:hypothetical protein